MSGGKRKGAGADERISFSRGGDVSKVLGERGFKLLKAELHCKVRECQGERGLGGPEQRNQLDP